MNRDEVSSPTVNTESTLLTAVVEAEEERDIATCDMPNAFIQTHVEEKDPQGNKTIMKIRGVLIHILCDIDPIYQDYVKIENQQKMLYVHVTKAIYGLLESAMLFYRRLTKDLIEFGFKINPYDPCVENKQVDGTQMTVSWHVDALKVSHANSKHIDDFITWVKQTYGTIGEVKTTRGKVHQYLGMKLDYTVKRQVTIDMVDYVNKMISEFPQENLKGAGVTSPWSENVFQVNEASPLITKNMAEQFHNSTAQGLFLCKREDQI
jgi:Reverse transcriptase (RNA-dependent DNA polymerase)